MSLLIDKVTKKFNEVKALNNISIEINEGEFIAILGPSGCGKTTLLRIIAGFIEPTEGSVKMGDKIYFDSKTNLSVEERSLGMIFQSFALWPHMSVKKHIEFPLNSKKSKSLSAETRKNMIEKAISSTGLKELSERLPGELSGGQKQRVAFARAIVSKPDILLMDEPLSSLDAELKLSMRKEIQDIHKMTGSTIIYVTHDQSEALAMADRIIIMKDGKIEQIGTPEDIYNNPKTEFVASFVSKCNILRGNWKGDDFFVEGQDISYSRGKIDGYFLNKNIYPLRPEDIEIRVNDSNSKGLEGNIINSQYNGREIHYTVKVKEDYYVVYSQENKKIDIGEKVILLNKKEIIS